MEKRSPHLWRRVLAGILSMLVLLLALLIMQLPEMIRERLQQYGVEQASVEAIHLNLLMGQLTVTGVEMVTPGRPPLRVGEASIQWQWLPLFSKQLVITHLQVDDVTLSLYEEMAGWMVSPLVLPPSEHQEKAAEPPTEETTPWGLSLRGVAINHLALEMPLMGDSHRFELAQFRLGAIDLLQPQLPAELQFALKHPAAQIGFGGELTPLAQPLQLSGKLTLEQVDLKQLSRVMDDAELTLVGEGRAALGLDVTVDSGEVTVGIDGDIGLKRFSYDSKGLTISAAEADWQGVVDLQIPPTKESALLSHGGTLALKGGELLLPDSGWVVSEANLNSATKLELFRNEEQGTDTVVELFELYDSQLTLTDNSVPPPYVTRLDQLQLHLEGFDMRDPSQAAQVALSTQLDEYGRFKMEGSIAPLKEHPEMHISGALGGINLPPLSSYTGEHLGYNLQQGQMDGRFVLDLLDEMLDTTINLKLRQLELTTKDPEQIKSLTEQLAMPLDKALDVLRDSDNVIDLEIKIAGKLDELQVDSSQVMNKALGNSMKYAVITYAKYAIQPFGMIATASEVLGMLVAVRFEPLIFEVGSSELSERHLEYLEKVSDMLDKKPEMVLSLCGVSAMSESKGVVSEQSDEQTVKELLRSLATARAERVKRYLVEMKGIDQSRLFVCHPKLDEDEKSEGRVEVLL